MTRIQKKKVDLGDFLQKQSAAVRWEQILKVGEDCQGISEVSVAKHTQALSPPLPLLSLFSLQWQRLAPPLPSSALPVTLPFLPGLAGISTREIGPMDSKPHHTGLQWENKH